MSRGHKVRRRTSETNRSVVIIALLSVLLGLFLFWLANRAFLSDEWTSIATNVGGLVIATGLLAVLWEVLGKRAFTAELLAKTQLSTDLAATWRSDQRSRRVC